MSDPRRRDHDNDAASKAVQTDPPGSSGSRTTHETLVNSINGIVWEADARTWRFTMISHQAEAMLGYAAQQWLDDPGFWVEHMHPQDRVWAPAYCMQQTRRKAAHVFEYRMIAADGRTVWIRDVVSVVVENDEPVALRGVMVDVTDRKQVEDALRSSEERLRHALLASNTGLWEWHTETDQVSLSPEWKAQLGYQPDELLDTFDTWESRLHPQDHDRSVAFAHDWLRSPQRQFRQEYRLRHRNGSYRWFEAHGSFVEEPDGRRVRLVGSHTDITDRKQAEDAMRRSEANLANAQRMAQLGSWERSVQSLQMAGSHEVYRIFELDPTRSENTYQRLLATVHPDDRARVRRAHADAVETQAPYDLVYRLRMEDGRIKYVHEHGETRCPADGTPGHSIGTVQDVTGRMLAEQERDELARRLIEARENERRAVARDLHDEIGQSLTALKLLLQAGGSGRPTAANLKTGSAIVDQILQQVRDLSLSLHPTALEELGLSWALKGHVEQEGLRAGLDVDLQIESVDETLPSSIATACFRIAQEAFTNVIRHAGATQVLVRLRRMPEGLELLVRDNGVGMGNRPAGNTLGVAGMRERARLLGGALRIESRILGGTDVLATLPLSSAVASGDASSVAAG